MYSTHLLPSLLQLARTPVSTPNISHAKKKKKKKNLRHGLGDGECGEKSLRCPPKATSLRVYRSIRTSGQVNKRPMSLANAQGKHPAKTQLDLHVRAGNCTVLTRTRRRCLCRITGTARPINALRRWAACSQKTSGKAISVLSASPVPSRQSQSRCSSCRDSTGQLLLPW